MPVSAGWPRTRLRTGGMVRRLHSRLGSFLYEMSVPTPSAAPSLSSSGFEDGLGRRALAFDRETGDMLEQLVLRPELAAFERVLQERMAALGGLEDERFARPRAVQRDDEERLIVVSEYVPGRRLSEALDAAHDCGIVAGLDAALGLLLEILPALGTLHGVAGFPHGSIAPARVMFTPAGQIVLLDAIYAAALERLAFTRQRLWAELGIAALPPTGATRFDIAADLTQAGMTAAALIVGRPLAAHDFPDGLKALRSEILEVGEIRGSSAFAKGLEKFFDRVLPIQGRKAFPSADDAVLDLRQLVRREIGIDACRSALLDFLQQVEAADAERTATEDAIAIARAEQVAAEREQARVEAERQGRERLEAERRERERLEAEARERARLEAERRERERIAAERKERERLEAERREQERLEAERKERERLEAERIERERLEAERRENARLEAERREQERLEAERRERERLEAERRERERLEAERLERERVERERVERERLEAEQRERERLEAERREKERLERERLERERLEAELRERARLEAERLEQERLERERLERERLEAEQRERARLEAERREKERLEAERREKERLEAERKERERLEAERREKERLEAERKERERLEAERREKERLEAERKERERLDAERREKERLEAERKERERLDAVRREKERLEAERKNEERREQEEIAARAAADESAEIGGSSKRRKRDKSARSKKDRLRSSAPAPAPAPPQPVAAAAPPASKSGWLVPPDRAAAFEAPVPQPTAPDVTRSFPVYVPPAVPPVQAMPSVAPTPVVMAPPAAVPAPASAPIPIGFAPPKPAVPQHAAPIAVAQPAPIRLKHEAAAPPANYSPRRDREVALAPAGEISANPTDGPSGGGIPWKLAAAAGVVLVIGIAGARFMPSGSRTPGPQPTTTTASKAPAPTPAPSATAGQVIISTDPPGARVLLDGKTVGESPVTLPTVPPGRHTITLVTESGSVKRAVRVEAGKTLTVDVPIFSGFVAVSAPIIVEIAEAGRLLGTSENQVMLSPGRHQLRFTNRALHYEATQTVEIEPGEVFKLGLDPRGTANINAVPWAEVWIDGVKAGETPIANVSIPLGVREIVFRNPQFGERKVTTTVTGGPPAALSVDFTKH